MLAGKHIARLTAMKLAAEAAATAKNDASLIRYKNLIDSLLLLHGTKEYGPALTKAIEVYGYARQTMRDAVERLVKIQIAQAAGAVYQPSVVDRAYGGVIGNPPRYCDEHIGQLAKQVDLRANRGEAVKTGGNLSAFHDQGFTGFVPGSAAAVSETLRLRALHAQFIDGNIPARLLKPPSAKTTREQFELLPNPNTVVSDWNTRRRKEEDADFRNAMSYAACMAYLFRWIPELGLPPDRISPKNTWNFDFSSIWLSKDGKLQVYIGKDTSKKLRKQNRSVKTMRVSEDAVDFGNKETCYGYGVMTSEDGALGAFVLSVKDKCYKGKDFEIMLVSVHGLLLASRSLLT